DLDRVPRVQWVTREGNKCSVTRRDDGSFAIRLTQFSSHNRHYLRYWKGVGVVLRTPYNGFSFPSLDV
ncbi:MAG: hypothetical protein Q8Q10_04000, partial [bacterium]|nr:hypothetical protein [bacterium]